MCIHTETNGVSYHSTVCFIQSSFPKLTGCKISPINLRRWTKVYSVTQGLTVPRAGPVPRGALISFWTHYFKRVLPSFPLRGNFMVVQWLGFGTFISGAPGSIPRQGTKIPQALWHDQKKKNVDTWKPGKYWEESGRHSKVPPPHREMTEGPEMSLKRRGQCLQASECTSLLLLAVVHFLKDVPLRRGPQGWSSILGQGAHHGMMGRRCRFWCTSKLLFWEYKSTPPSWI